MSKTWVLWLVKRKEKSEQSLVNDLNPHCTLVWEMEEQPMSTIAKTK